MIGGVWQMRGALRKNLLFQLYCFAGALFVMVFEYTRGAISFDQLRLCFVLLVGCLLILILFRRYFLHSGKSQEGPRSEASPARIDKAVGKLKVAVVLLPVLLIVGLLMTRGAPLAPRLVGALVNLCLTFWFITLIRRAKKKLNQQMHAGNSGMRTE
jgi:hypothetical protein